MKTAKIKSVLIIEDEPEVRHFVSRVLQLEGYDVLQAEDADAGFSLARARQVVLVILDLRLPGRDGFSVLAEIKSDPELSSVPVIVFTASAGVYQKEKALGMGAASYLVKPLSVATLKEAVNHVLRPRR